MFNLEPGWSVKDPHQWCAFHPMGQELSSSSSPCPPMFNCVEKADEAERSDCIFPCLRLGFSRGCSLTFPLLLQHSPVCLSLIFVTWALGNLHIEMSSLCSKSTFSGQSLKKILSLWILRYPQCHPHPPEQPQETSHCSRKGLRESFHSSPAHQHKASFCCIQGFQGQGKGLR